MLLSMTGFGEARRQKGGLTVCIEVRTVNNRFLKLGVRCSEGYSALEPRIEQAIRGRIRRGTVQLLLRVEQKHGADDYRINADILGRYRKQLDALEREWGAGEPIALAALLGLPGVVEEHGTDVNRAERDWPIIRETLEAAVGNLEQMRREEGKTMLADLTENCRLAAASLSEIEARAPLVADEYRARLHERLRSSLAELDVALDPGDVVREVALFAERADVAEEMIRLRSHFAQFEAIMKEPESAGRKLEFVAQEMLRETNTIGSKANDVILTRHVIEIKTALERIREMLQNVE